MVYLVVLFACAGLVYGSHRLRSPAWVLVPIAGLLALFAALRGPDIASDFLEYQEWYRLGSNADSMLERPPVVESLFLGLMAGSEALGLPFRVFLWGIALVAIAVKLLCIHRVALTPLALWSGACCYLFSGYLLHEFTQLRAGLAVAGFMLSLLALREGKTAAFLVVTLLGTLVHASALLGLVAWPLARWRHRAIDWTLGLSLALVASARIGGALSLEDFVTPLSALDPRLALYAHLAGSGITEAADPVSVRTGLMLLLIVAGYAALRSLRRCEVAEGVSPNASQHAATLLPWLRLLLLAQVALFLLADVKEAAVRIMEFWMACLPLYVAVISQTRGLRWTTAFAWLWLSATFFNYVFREPQLVAPYALGI
jgi:uncharacterized protein (DUF983 family)